MMTFQGWKKMKESSLINRFLMNQPWESTDSNMYACLHSCATDLDMTSLKFGKPINSILPLPTLQL